MLPEMFASGVALHKDLISATRLLDGVPAHLMHDWAKQHGVTIGGSLPGG